MSNVVYALMVRDVASGVERSRLDDALSGRITIPDPDSINPIDRAPDNIGPAVPNITDMDKLREEWGKSPSAIQEKLLFDREMRSLPRQKPGAN